ncbi:MAG: SAM-dependent methyltransferase, partial [Sphingobacteriales bacterium]
MYSSFQLTKKYLQYYRKAANHKGHGVHSPFIFDFIKNVLNNGNHYQPPAAIEGLRSKLLKNHQLVPVTDLGAGSRKDNITEKKISKIAVTALKPPKYAQLMHRLVRHYKPGRIIELGTSLGITTAYLSSGNPAANITTI